MRHSLRLSLIAALALVACGTESDPDSTADAGNTNPSSFTATIDGAAFSATDYSSHGRYDGDMKKIAWGMTAGDAAKSIRIWFGTDAEGKVTAGTYTVTDDEAPGQVILEYSPTASMVGKVGSGGQTATSGTLVLDEVYEDPQWGTRGGKGTFTASFVMDGTTVAVDEGTFDVRIPNGE